jgi:4-amino-4-deoxy-L-arabinose transferase-like glycosyltransferase
MNARIENTLHQIEKIFFHPLFWIGLLFVMRLDTINLPPMDAHAFRQCFTLGVSRSYVEQDMNFMHPRQLIVGDTDGLGPMEFPLFNYLIAILWSVFGQEAWCFRLLHLVVASLGLWSFWLILRRIVSERAALASMVIFGCGLSYIYARKAMPDVFGVSLVLIGVRFAWDYLEGGGNLRYLIWFFVFGAGGFLNKVSTIGCFSLLLLAFFDKKIQVNRKLHVIGTGLCIIGAFGLWYYGWIPSAERTYNTTWFFKHNWRDCIEEIFVIHLNGTIERFFPIALQSWVSSVFSFMGLMLVICLKNRRILGVWMAYSSLFLLFMAQVGHNFSQHEYYVLPYTPMMAILAGYFLGDWMTNKWLYGIFLVAIVYDATSKKRADFFIPWQDAKFTKLEKSVDSVVPKDALIYTNGMGGNQVLLFFAHRRGWQDEKIPDSTWFANKTRQGLGYAVIERIAYQDSLPYPMLFEDNDFRIYKIKKEK